MIEVEILNRARRLLQPPPPRDPAPPMLGAAFLAAVSALMLAGAVILGPGFETVSAPTGVHVIR